MRDREHLVLFCHPSQSVPYLQPHASANSRIHLIEDESGHLVYTRENCFEREHYARQLSA